MTMVKILIAGDFCPWWRVAKKIERGETAGILSKIGNVIGEADYAVVNLECPVTESASPEGIPKMGPVLSCRPQALELLRSTGFSMVTLANNHLFDCGQKGVESTLAACRAAGLATTGGGKNRSEAEKPFFKEISGVRIAFINICENEFSIADDEHGGAAPLDPIAVYYRIREVKRQADFVIVIVHGGHESYQLPSPRMQRTYRFFVDTGADAVINHHQHCYSGYEIHNGAPIFYGLGNFCFDWPGCAKNPLWNQGYAVTLGLEKGQDMRFELHPYVQCAEEASVRPMDERESRAFGKRIDELNSIIADTQQLGKAFGRMVSASRPLTFFTPYSNRYLSALYVRRLLPGFIGRKKKLRMLNMVRCEAHRDVLMEYLKKEK